MPFCTSCGNQLPPEARFCTRCGKPVIQMPVQQPMPTQTQAPVQQVPVMPEEIDLSAYCGTEKTFSFQGQPLVIPAKIDAFRHYRHEFRKLARQQVNLLRAEYCMRVRNLDSFLADFPVMYDFFRQPLLDAAMNILAEVGLYDVSPQQFAESHTSNFCLCGEDMDVMIDSFNKTIEANQERKAHGYNMLPGMVFSGVGGFVTAMAVNAAMDHIAEADIRNANVTPAQRAELFARINFETLMERAFLDYWRVFCSMTWEMYQRDEPIWYPTEQGTQRAEGLFQNLTAGRIPPQKQPEAIVTMLLLNPFADERIEYLKQRYGRTGDLAEICDYLGY